MMRIPLISVFFAALQTLFLGPHVYAQTQSFEVSELAFNNGDTGAVITFGTNTTIEVTEDSENKSLNITLPIAVRLKCGTSSNSDVCVLLAGESVDPNQDSDKDGVPDSTPDACPGTPLGTIVDDTGCPLETTSPDEYCAGYNQTTTSCSPNTNHDVLYESSAEYIITIPSGKILAVPFKTINSSTAYGSLTHTTDVAQGSYVFKSWFSTTPGAPIVSDATICRYDRPPESPIEWNQNESRPGCALGQSARVLYLNYQPNTCEFPDPETDPDGEPDCTRPYNSPFEIRISRNVFSQ